MSASSTRSTVAEAAYRDICQVRIWQWQGDGLEGSLQPRFGSSVHQLQAMAEEQRLAEATNCEQELDRVKRGREEKASNCTWSGRVTWIHIPSNHMDLCEVSFLLAACCNPFVMYCCYLGL